MWRLAYWHFGLRQGGMKNIVSGESCATVKSLKKVIHKKTNKP